LNVQFLKLRDSIQGYEASRDSGERKQVRVRVFARNDPQYEDPGASEAIDLDQWRTVTFDVMLDGSSPVLIRPADGPCVVELGGISIIDQYSGKLRWNCDNPAGLRTLKLSGSSLLLPREDKFLLFSFGCDPNIELPVQPQTTGRARIKISLRIDSELHAVADALAIRTRTQSRSIEQLLAEADAHIANLRLELKSAHAERMFAAAEVSRIASERNEARRDANNCEKLLETARARETELLSKIKAVEESLSWRVTRPARSLATLVRKSRTNDA
jgi:hypothetical protein